MLILYFALLILSIYLCVFLLQSEFLYDIVVLQNGGECMINGIENGSSERLKLLRKTLNLTQMEFAEIINSSNGHVSDMEKGRKNITDSTMDLLELKKNVNIDWLKTGEGEMFLSLPLEDEMAAYVEDLLADDGENELYNIIKAVMRTYNDLSPKSQEVLRDASAKLVENLKKERED